MTEDLFLPLRQLTVQEFDQLQIGDTPHFRDDLVRVINITTVKKGARVAHDFMTERPLRYITIRTTNGESLELETHQHYLLKMNLP